MHFDPFYFREQKLVQLVMALIRPDFTLYDTFPRLVFKFMNFEFWNEVYVHYNCGLVLILDDQFPSFWDSFAEFEMR